jgi:hypothetical protein
MPVGEAHAADILELGRRGFAEIDVRHGFSPAMLIARNRLGKGNDLIEGAMM